MALSGIAKEEEGAEAISKVHSRARCMGASVTLVAAALRFARHQTRSPRRS
jgi:hypothetical protein